jgi:hypothetical protein
MHCYWCVVIRITWTSQKASNMLLVKKTEKTKNNLRMSERCRNLIPVSKGNRGNKKRMQETSSTFEEIELYVVFFCLFDTGLSNIYVRSG